MTSVLVAVIGGIFTLGAAIITVRLGRVEKLVNGRLTRLLEMIDERDGQIRELLEERDRHG